MPAAVQDDHRTRQRRVLTEEVPGYGFLDRALTRGLDYTIFWPARRCHF